VTVPTNTLIRSATVGVREDLEDDVYLVDQEDKPYTSMVGKVKIKGTLHEFQEDAYAARDPNNAQYEGDDVTTHTAVAQPTRKGIYAQIFRKDGSISGTVNAADLAGRDKEIQRAKTKQGVELTLDMESRFIGNYASVNETPASVTRKTAGIASWGASNDSFGAGGSSGGWSSAGVVAAATNGTQRTFTEALLKGVLVTGFTLGARYKAAFMSGTHKQIASAFTGIADIRATVSGNSQATIYGAADRYVSDFGAIDFYAHPDLSRDCVLINPEFCKIGTYRGVATEPLAKTGDSIRWMTTAEKANFCTNQKQVAVIRDLT